MTSPSSKASYEGVPDVRTVVALLDGSNLWNAARSLGIRIDLRKLRQFVAADRSLQIARYYTALYPGSPVERILCDAQSRGWDVAVKPIREAAKYQKGDMDAWIGGDIAAFGVAGDRIFGKRTAEIALIAGDGDFEQVVMEHVKPYGVRLHVIGSRYATNGRMSQKLARIADEFTELKAIASQISL